MYLTPLQPLAAVSLPAAPGRQPQLRCPCRHPAPTTPGRKPAPASAAFWTHALPDRRQPTTALLAWQLAPDDAARATGPAIPPARNANAVSAFNCGKRSTLDLMKVTTAAILRCESAVEAIACLEALDAARDPATGMRVVPDRAHFNAAIGVCAQHADDTRAMELFNGMLLRGLCPDAVTYHAAMVACVNCRNAVDAVGLLRHMQMHQQASGARMNPRLYNAAISACVQAQRFDAALALFDEMVRNAPATGVHPDADTFAAAMLACGGPGVDGLLQQGLKAGVFHPSLGFNVRTNHLDLCERAHVVVRQRRCTDAPMNAPMACAVFRLLRNRGVIGPETTFSVGGGPLRHLEATIERCRRKAGWGGAQPAAAPARD